MDQPSVYFKVLGPVTAVCREGRLPLGGGKKRTLLAVLLLHANEVVSLYQLVDAIWGSAPCDSAVQQVRGLVCAVRNQLAGAVGPDEIGPRLVTQHGVMNSL